MNRARPEAGEVPPDAMKGDIINAFPAFELALPLELARTEGLAREMDDAVPLDRSPERESRLVILRDRETIDMLEKLLAVKSLPDLDFFSV